MKNKTVRVIIILVGLLVINIEAAHAGITHKFRLLISHEFSDFQLLYVCTGLLSLSVFGYIIFTPAFKKKGNHPYGGNYFQNYGLRSFQHKRKRIKKINMILKNARIAE